MLRKKQTIINRFNRSAATYATVADVQAQVAEKLASLLGKVNPHTILEVGCGTGFLSRYLVKLFPQASLLLTDIAPAMLQQCRVALPQSARIRLACMDAEMLAFNTTFDLLVSSMTLHWCTDLQRSFIDMTQCLQPGGHFFFSLLGENSFKEWQAICRALAIPIATPIFPAEHLLQTMLPQLQIEVVTYQQTYPNAYAFLRSLKNLGATAARLGYTPLSAGKLRQVLRHVNSAITISYEVIYGQYSRA
jgi:malonyl-CoA O-methyltransferase